VCVVCLAKTVAVIASRHLTQILHETHSNVDYRGLLLKQAQTQPTVLPGRKQTTGMHLNCCKALQYV